MKVTGVRQQDSTGKCSKAHGFICYVGENGWNLQFRLGVFFLLSYGNTNTLEFKGIFKVLISLENVKFIFVEHKERNISLIIVHIKFSAHLT